MEGIVETLLNPSVLIGLFVGVFISILCYFVLSSKTVKVVEKTSKKKPEVKIPKNPPHQPKPKQKPSNKKICHSSYASSFKGHAGNVTDADLSSNGKFLATCSDDRTVFLWDARDLKAKEHKSVRINIDFDHPTFVKWSPDNKAFLIHRYQDGNIEVYKVDKKKDGSLGHATVAHTFPKVHEEEVIGMSISSNGKFIMTCSTKNDLVLWDLKGQIIAKVDTCLMTTFCAKISPCGTFVLASGFSPDAKVWEVIFSKNGEFLDVKRAFELSGHSSGIYDVSCNADSSQMVTVSKDGTWRLFDTKVEFRKGQDARLIKSGKYSNPEDEEALVALSPNGVIVIAVNNTLQFFSAFNGTLDQKIEDVCEGKINRVFFDATGYYLLAAGYRQVTVFHNLTGYKCDIHDAQQKLKEHQTSATKERLQKIIKDSQAFLDSIQK
ncbi:transducin beta-like protein 2 isoform X2 [Coccinella septempunctata]|uniref:transducin beta-like protein 2 isoform X2 n=1 Tax=Coccinella septempunctata TaxID=41139 RepID=UPI001D08145D|nr:transducin beta-like protein 2 isoform X2 [Coccinella septempunctata]